MQGRDSEKKRAEGRPFLFFGERDSRSGSSHSGTGRRNGKASLHAAEGGCTAFSVALQKEAVAQSGGGGGGEGSGLVFRNNVSISSDEDTGAAFRPSVKIAPTTSALPEAPYPHNIRSAAAKIEQRPDRPPELRVDAKRDHEASWQALPRGHTTTSPASSRRSASARENFGLRQRESRTEDSMEKQAYLMDLAELKKHGVALSKDFSIEDRLEDMEFEIQRHTSSLATKNQVEFMKDMMKLILNGIEMANERFGPFLSLKGWASSITGTSSEMQRFDRPLERIYKRHWRRASMSPISELGWLLFGSMFAWHVKSKLFSGVLQGLKSQAPSSQKGGATTPSEARSRDASRERPTSARSTATAISSAVSSSSYEERQLSDPKENEAGRNESEWKRRYGEALRHDAPSPSRASEIPLRRRPVLRPPN